MQTNIYLRHVQVLQGLDSHFKKTFIILDSTLTSCLEIRFFQACDNNGPAHFFKMQINLAPVET
jgi:hypothetical protein